MDGEPERPRCTSRAGPHSHGNEAWVPELRYEREEDRWTGAGCRTQAGCLV